MVGTDIENILQYQFKDPALLEEALHANGSIPSTSLKDPRKHRNKALALIGDAILRLVVVSDGIDGGKTLRKSFISSSEKNSISQHSTINLWIY
jgi:ribonuclease-3